MSTQRGVGPILRSCACFFVLCLLIVLPGCERPGKVERGLLLQIRRSCVGPKSCSIRIRDFTAFDWDKAFYFNDATTEEERSSALGTREEGYWEFEDQLVFLKNGRVVYQESEPTDIEKPIKDQIGFAAPEDRNFTSFAPDAVFAVSIEEGPNGSWFLLKQIQ